jgi:two-component system, NtrC family, response regulator AtoC
MSIKPSVLVVDDEKLIRWSVSKRLSRSGYKTTVAESGEEALSELGGNTFQLMLLDVRLPGIDGIEVLERSLSLCPELIVIMMSAHSTVDVAVEAMKKGATDFLVKPFPLEALELSLDRALQTAQTKRRLAVLTAERTGCETAIDTIIGESPQMKEVKRLVGCAADSAVATCLIDGESGSGKEVVARAIHFTSARADGPFLQLNCAALPEHLIESELFGHEKGAFTDAHAAKRGLFESAEGGTVFLDEIGEMPAGGQAKLLTLLENKAFRRVGGVTEFPTNVRVLAATNVDLDQSVSEGRFRPDLFFRLNIVRISIPPLRDHSDDIPILLSHFLASLNQEMKRDVRGVSPEALDLMMDCSWPGNVRQLRNAIERALILHPAVDILRPEHLGVEIHNNRRTMPTVAMAAVKLPVADLKLDDQEKDLIIKALGEARGNQSKAARLLGITRDTLRYRMRKHEL